MDYEKPLERRAFEPRGADAEYYVAIARGYGSVEEFRQARAARNETREVADYERRLTVLNMEVESMTTKLEIRTRMGAILDGAKSENRGLTESERTEFDRLEQQYQTADVPETRGVAGSAGFVPRLTMRSPVTCVLATRTG